jgi:hypothetical protein
VTQNQFSGSRTYRPINLEENEVDLYYMDSETQKVLEKQLKKLHHFKLDFKITHSILSKSFKAFMEIPPDCDIEENDPQYPGVKLAW